MSVPVPTAPPTPEKHSHAGGILSLFLLIFGFGLAYLFSPILSGLLALLVLWMGWKFLKWRVDPLDMFFWMKHKPSWAAVGLTFLSGLGLLGVTYWTYAHIDAHQFIEVRHVFGLP